MNQSTNQHYSLMFCKCRSFRKILSSAKLAYILMITAENSQLPCDGSRAPLLQSCSTGVNWCIWLSQPLWHASREISFLPTGCRLDGTTQFSQGLQWWAKVVIKLVFAGYHVHFLPCWHFCTPRLLPWLSNDEKICKKFPLHSHSALLPPQTF